MIYGSVCSGIEAATVAWHPLGWRAAWYAEIDKFASAVLAHRYPEVRNLGDFTQIDARRRRSKLMFSWEEPPASPSPSLATGLDWMTRVATSRWSFSDWLLALDRDGSSGRTSPECCPSTEDGRLEPSSGRWQTSGTGSLTEFWTLSSSECPSAVVASSLLDILEGGRLPLRYFLSAKACAGILRRAENRGRSLPPLLRTALERVAAIPKQAQAGHILPAAVVGHSVSAKWAKRGSGPSGSEYHNLVAHTLRGEGFDATEDGSGKGIPSARSRSPARITARTPIGGRGAHAPGDGPQRVAPQRRRPTRGRVPWLRPGRVRPARGCAAHHGHRWRQHRADGLRGAVSRATGAARRISSRPR